MNEDRKLRQFWIGVLARSSRDELEKAWENLPEKPDYIFLRKPETGLTMVQARAGNTGRQFCLGEMTVTRCVVRLGNGETGYGYVAGRTGRRAELCAVFDALLQNPDIREDLMAGVIKPMSRAQKEARRKNSLKVSPTKVDFFTMVRGDE